MPCSGNRKRDDTHTSFSSFETNFNQIHFRFHWSVQEVSLASWATLNQCVMRMLIINKNSWSHRLNLMRETFCHLTFISSSEFTRSDPKFHSFTHSNRKSQTNKKKKKMIINRLKVQFGPLNVSKIFQNGWSFFCLFDGNHVMTSHKHLKKYF